MKAAPTPLSTPSSTSGAPAGTSAGALSLVAPLGRSGALMSGAGAAAERNGSNGGGIGRLRKGHLTAEGARPAIPPPPKTALEAAEVRERTVSIHGVSPQLGTEGLLQFLRPHCGHVVSARPSQSQPLTTYVTFSTRHGADVALSLPKLGVEMGGQRFAVAANACFSDDDDDATEGPAHNKGHHRGRRLDIGTPGGTASTATKPSAVLIPSVRWSRGLSLLPFADRWIMPLFTSRHKEVSASAPAEFQPSNVK